MPLILKTLLNQMKSPAAMAVPLKFELIVTVFGAVGGVAKKSGSGAETTRGSASDNGGTAGRKPALSTGELVVEDVLAECPDSGVASAGFGCSVVRVTRLDDAGTEWPIAREEAGTV